jgi:hypothetical protein
MQLGRAHLWCTHSGMAEHFSRPPVDELHCAAAEEAAAAAAQRPEAQPETTATGLGTAGSGGSSGVESAAGSDAPAAAPSVPAAAPSAPAPEPSAPAPVPSAPAPAPSAPKPDSSGFIMVRASCAPLQGRGRMSKPRQETGVRMMPCKHACQRCHRQVLEHPAPTGLIRHMHLHCAS